SAVMQPTGQRAYAARIRPRLARRASRGIPLRSVRLQLEVRAREELACDVNWVLEDFLDDQVGSAVRLCDAIEVFGHGGLVAIRHAVLAPISGPHVGRDRLK